MCERPSIKREKDWNDEIPDEEEYQPEPYEKPYKDGSTKNECWSEE